MNATDYIALAASIISIVAFLRTIFIGKRQKILDLQMIEINKHKLLEDQMEGENSKMASIKLYTSGYSGKRTIRVMNDGKAQARNVMLSFQDAEGLYLNYNKKARVLDPGAVFEIPMHLAENCSDNLTVTITWDDNYDTDRKVDRVLPIS